MELIIFVINDIYRTTHFESAAVLIKHTVICEIIWLRQLNYILCYINNIHTKVLNTHFKSLFNAYIYIILQYIYMYIYCCISYAEIMICEICTYTVCSRITLLGGSHAYFKYDAT